MNKQGAVFVAIIVLFALAYGAFKFQQAQTPNDPNLPHPPSNALVICFTYGSEKEEWVKEATAAFNQEQHKIRSGKPIFVEAIPMGSGDCIDEILSGRRQPHLISPASAAFIKWGNGKSRVQTGKDLIEKTENLVLSPVVIAMWKPMAETLGWGKKSVGWADILALARNPQGWAAYGHPEWGTFKFGHTHPEFSNSGLISLLAEVYAARKKVTGLTLADVNSPSTSAFLNGIEHSVVHYGSSTGFFGHKLFENGPGYLSAAVLYENMIPESYDESKYHLPFPVVAIYPKEGTFWSDHPVGIVQRDWVTNEHREAAQAYIDYLLAQPQQQRALEYGFRPAEVSIPLTAPIDMQHGVNPKEPKTTLEVPSAEVINAVISSWHKYKKHSNIVLVFDTSGSMNDNNKLINAREGAYTLLDMLGDDDRLSILPFNDTLTWAGKGTFLKDSRHSMHEHLAGMYAGGGTALYQAISEAYQYLQDTPQPDKISAVIVLTDGEDTSSNITLDMLSEKIRSDSEHKSIRVFTIGYGKDAKKEILQKIANDTQAKFYEGTPQNIREVFKDISTFF